MYRRMHPPGSDAWAPHRVARRSTPRTSFTATPSSGARMAASGGLLDMFRIKATRRRCHGSMIIFQTVGARSHTGSPWWTGLETRARFKRPQPASTLWRSKNRVSIPRLGSRSPEPRCKTRPRHREASAPSSRARGWGSQILCRYSHLWTRGQIRWWARAVTASVRWGPPRLETAGRVAAGHEGGARIEIDLGRSE